MRNERKIKSKLSCIKMSSSSATFNDELCRVPLNTTFYVTSEDLSEKAFLTPIEGIGNVYQQNRSTYYPLSDTISYDEEEDEIDQINIKRDINQIKYAIMRIESKIDELQFSQNNSK